MKKLIHIAIATTIISLVAGNLWAQESRASIKVKNELSQNFNATTLVQYRTEQTNESPIRSLVGQYKVKYDKYKYIEPALSVRYKYKWNSDEQESQAKGQDRFRFTSDIEFKIPEPIKKISLYDRVRYQYSLKEPEKTKHYLRNEITFKYAPSKLLSAYVSHEIFYDIRKDEMDIMRLQFCLMFKLDNRHKVGGFYMVENNYGQKDSSYHITGLELIVKI